MGWALVLVLATVIVAGMVLGMLGTCPASAWADGVPGSDLRASRTVRVALGVDQTGVRLTGRGEHELWNLATGALVGRASQGAVWILALCAEGIQVSLAPVVVPGAPGQQDLLGDPQPIGVFTGPLRLRSLGAPPADTVSASLRQEGISLPGGAVPPPGMGWERGPDAPATFLWYGGLGYRGEMEVFPGRAGLTVVNVIPLEEYLYGVVGIEMSPSWPAEALKAQAVAARTYAVGKLAASQAASGQSGPSQGGGYDLLATPVDQAYRGLRVESGQGNGAVEATRGRVLTYQGRLASAFYHASSGGHTENVENVWGTPLPYLRGVPDPEEGSPWQHWEKEISLADVGAALAAGGKDVGEVYRIEPAGPQGVSGRWTQLAVIGSRGRVVLTGSQFYRLVGLRSACFQMEPCQPGIGDYVQPVVANGQVQVLSGQGRQVAMSVKGTAVVSATGLTRLGQAASSSSTPPAWLFPSPPSPEPSSSPVYVVARRWLPARIHFTGSGWGHGVGMSQYGARTLALRGYTYDRILGYYYQGTVLQETPVVSAK